MGRGVKNYTIELAGRLCKGGDYATSGKCFSRRQRLVIWFGRFSLRFFGILNLFGEGFSPDIPTMFNELLYQTLVVDGGGCDEQLFIYHRTSIFLENMLCILFRLLENCQELLRIGYLVVEDGISISQY